MASILVQSIALATGAELARATTGKVTPMRVITAAMTILDTYKNLRGRQKRELLVEVIDMLSNNVDGVDGTADDLVPPAVASVLRDLVRSDTVGEIVDQLCAMRAALPPWLARFTQCAPPCAR